MIKNAKNKIPGTRRCVSQVIPQSIINRQVFWRRHSKIWNAGSVSHVSQTFDQHGYRNFFYRTRTGRRVHIRRGLYNAEAIGRSWAVPSDNGRICGGPMRRPPPRRNFCSGARRESAKIQCMTLKRNSQVFRACTRRRVLQVEFAIFFENFSPVDKYATLNRSVFPGYYEA